jgi:hypothetical protein
MKTVTGKSKAIIVKAKSQKSKMPPLDIEDTKNDAMVDQGEDEKTGRKFFMLNLEPDGGKFGVKMGLRKLKAVLEHISQVRRYVASEGKEC